MIKLNEEHALFVKDFLENELADLNLTRSKCVSVKMFDKRYGERMEYIKSIIREINSAHGKHIHGHTFRIEINFVDKLVNNMVGNIDFHEINPKIDEVIKKLDKTYIDDVIQTKGTVENIASYIIKELKDQQNLYSVIVYEGKNQYVEVLKEEVE